MFFVAVQGHHKALNGFLSKLTLFSAEGPFSFAKVKELGGCVLTAAPPTTITRALGSWHANSGLYLLVPKGRWIREYRDYYTDYIGAIMGIHSLTSPGALYTIKKAPRA